MRDVLMNELCDDMNENFVSDDVYCYVMLSKTFE